MAVRASKAAISGTKEKTFRFVDWKPFAFMFVVITTVAMIYRVYQQMYAWDYGMDSFEPEFQTYWMNLFYSEVAVIAIAAAILWPWLWMTRERSLDHVTPREEIRRWFYLIAWLGSYVLAAYYSASFFGEQDATWHQTAIRDTDFTPSHIVVFYGTFPSTIVLGVASWIYAKTRIPYYSKGIPIALTIAVAGPYMILPNIGFNEFGHTFWFMEELFAHPLHYGFVVFGWAAVALGGVLIGACQRFLHLMNPAKA
jgi:methane/ammonia monooxygenase subunit C